MSALPHEPVEELEPNLRTVVGHNPKTGLMRRMTAVRRDDGTLLLHSPVLLEERAMQSLESWGAPAFIVVPGAYHRRDAAAFAARWPAARVFCPRGAERAVRQKVRVDGAVQEIPADSTVRFEPLEGTREAEAAMLVRSGARNTVVFNDAVFNLPHLKGLTGFLMRYVTGSTGKPRVTNLFRWFAVTERGDFRAHLLRLAQLPDLARVVVSHGATIDQDPAGVLRRVAEEL